MIKPIDRLCRRDHQLLQALREHASLGFASQEVLDRLERKLSSSEVIDSYPTSNGHVQIGSTIRCDLDDRITMTLRLVLSARMVREPGDVPATSSLGIELLGCAVEEVSSVLAKHIRVCLTGPDPVPSEAGEGDERAHARAESKVASRR